MKTNYADRLTEAITKYAIFEAEHQELSLNLLEDEEVNAISYLTRLLVILEIKKIKRDEYVLNFMNFEEIRNECIETYTNTYNKEEREALLKNIRYCAKKMAEMDMKTIEINLEITELQNKIKEEI